jgi:hypothetical protein
MAGDSLLEFDEPQMKQVQWLKVCSEKNSQKSIVEIEEIGGLSFAFL